MMFDEYVGIDYSGADSADDRLGGLQVFRADNQLDPVRINPVAGPQRNWTRREVANWQIQQMRRGKRMLIGIDHAFSFPVPYFQMYGLRSWDAFLDDFCIHWPTHQVDTLVGNLLENNQRAGNADHLRLTEKWRSSGFGVVDFAQLSGRVALSTHAGIPWLDFIRADCREVHFWPFDGWDFPAGKCVIAEVYPANFKRRFEAQGRNSHEHDACYGKVVQGRRRTKYFAAIFSSSFVGRRDACCRP